MTDTYGYIATNMSNITSLKDFLQVANQSGAGYLFAMIDFLVFSVLFITLTTQFGWESALLSSSFIGILMSLLFSYMGILSWTFTQFFVGALVVMIFYIMWSNRNN
jgi:hypothetical protein